jgi:hypothetical protein
MKKSVFILRMNRDDPWAWQIKPDMSAVVAGAGYGFGACAITSLLLRNQWHSLNTALFATGVFSVAMLLATLLQLDRFFAGTPRLDVWFAIYLLLPLALPVAWFFNRRCGAPRHPGDLVFGLPIRIGLLLLGLLLMDFGLFMFVVPAGAAVVWPWSLTPLMSQVIGGWALFVGAGAAVAVFEPRYTAYRRLIPCTVVWGGALLSGSLVRLDAFDFKRLSPWVWFFVLLALILGNVAARLRYELRYRRRRRRHGLAGAATG